MENLKVIKRMLEGFEEKSRFYWIDALVKQGQILNSEAGWLIVELGLNK